MSEMEATSQTGVSSWPRWLLILTIITPLAVLFGLYMGLAYAGTDIEQGNVQRIFYVHMPAFFGAFFAFSAGVIGGIQYLRTRALKWDTLALAGIEVGIALAVVNLVGLVSYALLRTRFDDAVSVVNILFFVLLLTLLITLYDRYRQVYLMRFSPGV